MDQGGLEKKEWWLYLTENQRDLFSQAVTLLTRERVFKEALFNDYSFIVFPAAKAYEGFLKKLLFDLGFITSAQYSGEHFRIGKSLNPNLPVRYRKSDWVYMKLENYCRNGDVASRLWDTWKTSRNHVFHWFPQREGYISLKEAEEHINMIVQVIDETFTECRLKNA